MARIFCATLAVVVMMHLASGANNLKVRLIADKQTNKPRGYAFIEYMHTRDMKAAYKQADGKKIDNRRVLVDVERGRTVPNWRPRRLGGGLGTTRVGGEEVNQRYSGREQQQTGGPPRSEEPRVREDRDREREKSRDQEREREKSGERSHDRPRDRDRRDDRHQRDRERSTRDRNRDKDRGRERPRDRDHDRSRDYERDRELDRSGRDRDRHREKDRERERDRDYEDRDYEYEHVERHDREREKNYDTEANPEWSEQSGYRNGRSEGEHGGGGYDDYYDRNQGDEDRYADQDRDRERNDRMDEDDYEQGKLEPRDKDRAYPRDYEY